ncbi:MAG: peptide-binding protein [Acidobacteriota bacterium]
MRVSHRMKGCLAVAALACAAGACRNDQAPPVRPVAADGPRRGGQVIVGILSDVETFNEYQWSGDSYDLQIIDLLFPSLMIEQPDFELHPPSFAPNLASSWEFSQDNRVLTFRLRPEARWSDGVPVTAEDVRFTYQVQKDPRVGSPGLEIKDFITDVEVVDAHTVRFHFSRAYPYQLMDANDGHIIPAHAWGKVPLEKWHTTDFEPLLVTSGPFRVASHTRDQTLILERDPAYWGAPRPYLDQLVFRVIPDSTSQLNQLLAGDIQLVELVPPREAARVRNDPDLELVEYPGRTWGFIAWNNRRPLFADRRVRRALSLAINRKSLVETVYHGFAKLATGPILSSMWAYDRNLAPLPYDSEQARRLLAEAGWRDTNGDGVLDRDGKPFVFDLFFGSENPIRQDIAVLVQADLARVGITCRPTSVESTSLLARLESGNYEACVTAFAEATKVDLTSVWSTPSKTQGTDNLTGYSNPEVDRLIAAAREEPDYTRAKVLYDRIQELIVEDQPVTFLYEAQQLTGIQRRIRGADINSLSVFFNVPDWYLGP